jgi:hypothetical protein
MKPTAHWRSDILGCWLVADGETGELFDCEHPSEDDLLKHHPHSEYSVEMGGAREEQEEDEMKKA